MNNEIMKSEEIDKTEYYIYSYYHDIGKFSEESELILIEYLDVIQMFEESTIRQIKESKKMKKSLKDFLPMDGKCVEDDLFHHTIINCTDII